MMKRMILPTLVLALAAPAAALSQAAQPLTTPAFSGGYAEPQDDPAYERATEALDQAQYDEAIALFGAIAEQRGARADAALYWIAYSQSKSGQEAGALETIARLRALYPQSRWLNDAGYLEAEVRGAAGQAPADALYDEEQQLHSEEMRLYALNARALPMLQSILQADETQEMKSRALFVLMQSGGDDAFGIVAEVARTDADPELRRQAIRQIGMHGGDRASAFMSEIYDASDDLETRKAVLRGLMMSGDSGRLLEIARNEVNDELRTSAIRQLAMTGAADDIWTLYRSEQSDEAKKTILRAMFMTGDATRLLEVARSEPDTELRRVAIRGLATIGDDDQSTNVSDALVELYRGETDPELRVATLRALWMRGEAGTLIELFDQESDREMRRQIVQSLSMMDTEEAIEFLIRIIEQ